MTERLEIASRLLAAIVANGKIGLKRDDDGNLEMVTVEIVDHAFVLADELIRRDRALIEAK